MIFSDQKVTDQKADFKLSNFQAEQFYDPSASSQILLSSGKESGEIEQ